MMPPLPTHHQVVGVGIDLCAIPRIATALAAHPQRFPQRLCTPQELADKRTLLTDPTTLAKRWALKEAVAKSLGTGIGAQVSFQHITISHTLSGQPTATVQGYPHHHFHVSTSTDGGLATALCLTTTTK